jgi:hypothetical protein
MTGVAPLADGRPGCLELDEVGEGLQDEPADRGSLSTWRPNAATAWRTSSPNALRSPSGPTDPATAARPATASRASRAAASLSASVSAARPWWASFGGLAPKVFVSTSSAPASAYAAWIRLTTSGRRTFSSSKQAESGTPAA